MSHNTESVYKAALWPSLPELSQGIARRSTQESWDRYAASRKAVLRDDPYRVALVEAHTQRPAGIIHEERLQMAMRDQSEDRPTSRFIVAYMDGEPGRFSRLPWKVYDLWENPVMRGTQGRWSCATAREATELAVRLERKHA